MADLNCLTGVVTVTWEASAGANYYTVLAEANGRFDSCRSTTTSCDLTQMHCGEDYTVTVLAGDGKCNSSILTKTNVTTGKETEQIVISECGLMVFIHCKNLADLAKFCNACVFRRGGFAL